MIRSPRAQRLRQPLLRTPLIQMTACILWASMAPQAHGQGVGTPPALAGHRTDTSDTLERYADATVLRLRTQAARATGKHRTELEEQATCALLRNLITQAIAPPAGTSAITSDQRRAGLAALARLTTPLELSCALKVLDGEGSRPNFIASDAEVRRALFAAMASEPTVGQVELVTFAVTADDPVRQRAADALPDRLSDAALARLSQLLGSDRERHINRAASIASAHAAGSLIPALIQAQYAPPREKKGDEAWIVIGKQTRYVQNQIPIVGDASTSFQPVLGTIYEGSLLRIMESMVEIYRTEVHVSLAMVIEQTTGLPAPALGYDPERWMAWYRDDYPALAARHAEVLRRSEEEQSTVTTPGARDS